MQVATKLKMLKVARQAINLIKNYEPSLTLEEQCRQSGVLERMAQIKEEDLPFSECEGIKRGIGARNLVRYGGMRLTLHYLPQNSRIKLTENKVQKVRYLLHGELHAKFYTEVLGGLFKKEEETLNSHSVISEQGHAKEGSRMHELRALEPTFMMDLALDEAQPRPQAHTFFIEGRNRPGDLVDLKSARQFLDIHQF